MAIGVKKLVPQGARQQGEWALHPHTTKLPPLSRGTSRVGGCYRIPPMLLYRMYPEGSWAVAESPLPSRLRLLKSDPFETAPGDWEYGADVTRGSSSLLAPV